MFDDHSDPRMHLQRYHLEVISFDNDDDLLANLFSLSLKAEPLLWFTNFLNKSITCFNDIVKAFIA